MIVGRLADAGQRMIAGDERDLDVALGRLVRQLGPRLGCVAVADEASDIADRR